MLIYDKCQQYFSFINDKTKQQQYIKHVCYHAQYAYNSAHWWSNFKKTLTQIMSNGRKKLSCFYI